MKENDTGYSVFSKSAMGYSHRVKKIQNQDDHLEKSTSNLFIVGIADGHGSENCRYSQFGANFAVKVFCDSILEIHDVEGGDLDQIFKILRETRHEKFPKNIQRLWQDYVLRDYNKRTRQNNIRPEESTTITKEEIFVQYGTTLLGLVLAKDYYFVVQIGDGDILTVFRDFSVERAVIGEKILGVETQSLSSKNAWADFKCNVTKIDKDEEMPILFMLSTDGLSNSYVNDQAFLQVPIDYLNWLKQENITTVEKRTYDALKKISRLGSGDDITLSIAVNMKRLLSV